VNYTFKYIPTDYKVMHYNLISCLNNLDMDRVTKLSNIHGYANVMRYL